MSELAEPVVVLKGPIGTLKEASESLRQSGVDSVELLRPDECFGSS